MRYDRIKIYDQQWQKILHPFPAVHFPRVQITQLLLNLPQFIRLHVYFIPQLTLTLGEMDWCEVWIWGKWTEANSFQNLGEIYVTQ